MLLAGAVAEIYSSIKDVEKKAEEKRLKTLIDDLYQFWDERCEITRERIEASAETIALMCAADYLKKNPAADENTIRAAMDDELWNFVYRKENGEPISQSSSAIMDLVTEEMHKRLDPEFRK